MKTYGFDRIKLSRNLSIDELLQLEEEVKKASLNEFKMGFILKMENLQFISTTKMV